MSRVFLLHFPFKILQEALRLIHLPPIGTRNKENELETKLTKTEDNKEAIQGILCDSFMSLLRETTGRTLIVRYYGDKPDATCIDYETNKTVGIEITELLKFEEGSERSVNARSAKTVTDVLRQHTRGGIVSVGRGTVFPKNKQERGKLEEALKESVLKSGSFCEFASQVNSSHKWEYDGFVITEISENPKWDEWLYIIDQRIPFRALPLNEGDLIQTVARKARLSGKYEKVDELILVVRNTGTELKPNEDLRKKIAFANGNSYHSVWVINWKMNKLLAQPNIVHIDQ